MNMDFSYIVTPFFAWLLAGSIKFAINTIRAKRFAFDLIGYGGLPSNHSSIVTSVVAIIVFKQGINEPALAVALALAFIVILDANSLRQQVGKCSIAINKLNVKNNQTKLRERMGHTRIEILAGVFTGIATAWIVNDYFKIL